MKILFDNVLKDGTYASVNASANYPARNVSDGFLRIRYQGTTSSDSITVTLDETEAINSIYFGYVGNIDTIDVYLYSGGILQTVALGAEHETSTGGDLRIFETGVIKHFGAGLFEFFDDYDGEQFSSQHFDTVYADEIVISYTGTDPVYIGGVAAGLAEDIPAAFAAWDDTFRDGSTVTRSPHGQVQQQYIEPTKSFTFSFGEVGLADFYRVKDACMSVGSQPVWVTFFEDSEDDFPPGYYTVTMSGQRRSRLSYNFNLKFQEAR